MWCGDFKVLRELRGWPLEAVRALAVEIAMLGAQGINPTKKYALKGLPNRSEMYGEEVLAYYYVTWAKVFPDKLVYRLYDLTPEEIAVVESSAK